MLTLVPALSAPVIRSAPIWASFPLATKGVLPLLLVLPEPATTVML